MHNPVPVKRKFPREALYIAILLIGVLLSYSDAMSNGFAYDDVPIVEKNRLIRSWDNLPEIFSSGYWEPIGGTGGLYRPLTITSYLVEFSLSGTNPVLYHVDNIALHLLCCILMYFIVKRMTGDEIAAFAGTLVFGLHTIHVEAVANIVGRAELLSGLFTLAGLYVFMVRPRRLPWYIFSPMLLFLGLLSKEMAVVLPAIIFVYILLFERDGRGKDLKSITVTMMPYVAAVGVFMALRFYVLGSEVSPHGLGQVFIFTKPIWRLIVMLNVYVAYIRLALFPTDLQIHYMLRPAESVFAPIVLVLAGIIVVFAAFTPRLLRTGRKYFFFLVWFPIALLPVSNIIPTGVMMSERSMYLATVGSCAMMGLIFSRAIGWPAMPKWKTAALASTGLAVVATSLGVMTHQRNHVWHDTVSIDKALVKSYQRVTENFPESGLYYTHLANAYEGLHMHDEALAALKKAVEVEPNSFNYVKLAKRYRDMGRYDLALKAAEEAISHSKDLKSLDYGETADALIAEIYYRNGDYKMSHVFADKALSNKMSRDAESYAKVGIYLYNIGMVDKAEELFKKSIEINPYFANSHLNYGILLVERGDLDKALSEFTLASELDPDKPDPFFEQGLIYGQRAEFKQALTAMQKTVELAPDNAEYRYFLAASYIGVGNKEMAVKELKASLYINPDYKKAADLLASLNE